MVMGAASHAVHPRVRGGAQKVTGAGAPVRGPSPRARGSQRGDSCAVAVDRSIPACAGEPRPWRPSRTSLRVHPRVRGGAAVSRPAKLCASGPSPRARGSRPDRRGRGRSQRSIPACAGEPGSRPGPTPTTRVHPRVRGGAKGVRSVNRDHAGPSPRARGSLRLRRPPHRRLRSIPACAGEPSRPATGTGREPVHPRVRGGASAARSASTAQGGPSPRARGSPVGRVSALAGQRSIPACAGEPRTTDHDDASDQVHPRVRGGASRRARDPGAARGPSPRARGSRRRGTDAPGAAGSIPACAGEPAAPRRRARPAGVHPRVRGGASSRCARSRPTCGPSPRARGSRRAAAVRSEYRWSIPACAGEPGPELRTDVTRAVHPRVRGGALTQTEAGTQDLGPSPRARGSLLAFRPWPSTRGSIPACAGEPWRSASPTPPGAVHPRVRGGASPATATPRESAGPSPRARGSRLGLAGRRLRGRSIPACAGEPSRHTGW